MAITRAEGLPLRRGGDSNPRRRDYRRNGFRDRRIQPLCHLSAREFTAHPYPPSTATARQPHPPRASLPREKSAQHSLYLNPTFILISGAVYDPKTTRLQEICALAAEFDSRIEVRSLRPPFYDALL